jgi:hypothetical protein
MTAQLTIHHLVYNLVVSLLSSDNDDYIAINNQLEFLIWLPSFVAISPDHNLSTINSKMDIQKIISFFRFCMSWKTFCVNVLAFL